MSTPETDSDTFYGVHCKHYGFITEDCEREFLRQVNGVIESGWTPLGGISTTTWTSDEGNDYISYSQAFTKKPPTHTTMIEQDFGWALQQLKQGKCVRRQGWNGKGMYIALQSGSTITVENARGGAALFRAKEELASEITILPHIDMRAADGSIVVGWLASQTDMLSSDWEIAD